MSILNPEFLERKNENATDLDTVKSEPINYNGWQGFGTQSSAFMTWAAYTYLTNDSAIYAYFYHIINCGKYDYEDIPDLILQWYEDFYGKEFNYMLIGKDSLSMFFQEIAAYCYEHEVNWQEVFDASKDEEYNPDNDEYFEKIDDNDIESDNIENIIINLEDK